MWNWTKNKFGTQQQTKAWMNSSTHSSCMATLVERISSMHWFPTQVVLKEKDVVIVINPGARRRDWRVGRIVRTYPGAHGLNHVVDFKVGDKIL